MNVSKYVTAAPAALALAAGLLAAPPASAAGTDARVALQAAITASNIAYQDGVAVRGVLTWDFTSTAGDQSMTVTDETFTFEAGVTGSGLFGPNPNIDVIWDLFQEGSVVDPDVLTVDGDTATSYVPLARILEDFPLPKRTRSIVLSRIAAAGGDRQSFVPLITYTGKDAAERIADGLQNANPATGVAAALAEAPDAAVTAGTTAGGPDFQVAIVSPSYDGETSLSIDVFVNDAGLIDAVAITSASTSGIRAVGELQVTAVGDAVVVPPTVANRVNTPVVRQSVEHTVTADALRLTLETASRWAAGQAALDGTKVTRSALRAGLKEAGVFKNADYTVRAIRGGFAVRDTAAPGKNLFGPVCAKLVATKRGASVRAC